MTDVETIPENGSEWTADWFSRVLERSGALESGRVREVRTEPIGEFSNVLRNNRSEAAS